MPGDATVLELLENIRAKNDVFKKTQGSDFSSVEEMIEHLQECKEQTQKAMSLLDDTLHNLTVLNLNVTPPPVLDAPITVIQEEFNKKRLDIADAALLANALVKNTTVRELHLNNNKIRFEGVAVFAEVLTKNTTLQTLSLSGNGIDMEGAKALEGGLKGNTVLVAKTLEQNLDSQAQMGLRELDLSNNPLIGDEGAGYLSQGLEGNATLHKLNLRNIGFFTAGAIHLSKMLSVNKVLRELDLSGNLHMFQSGIENLFDALAENTTLKSLILQDNMIAPFTLISSIAPLIEKNTPLEVLDLRHNSITATAAEALLNALKKNTHLIELKLGDGVPYTLLEEIEEQLDENRKHIQTNPIAGPQPAFTPPPEPLKEGLLFN